MKKPRKPKPVSRGDSPLRSIAEAGANLVITGAAIVLGAIADALLRQRHPPGKE